MTGPARALLCCLSLVFTAVSQQACAAKSGGEGFTLVKVAQVDGEFWALDFLDANTIIATQKSGLLWLFRGGQRIGPIAGTPVVDGSGQAGLFGVRKHPDYDRNGWIYLAYAEPAGRGSTTSIVRGRIQGDRWTGQQTIYRAAPEFFISSGAHFGGRMAFRDGYLFFSVGERGTQDNAQNLANPFGKIHRIFDDGRVPADNPFASNPRALPTIWSYGHRNPQGLDFDSKGTLWSTEHGPRGGDELNAILPGRNYGWPLVTFGVNYDGSIVSKDTARPGLEPPRTHWVPSPALSGVTPYEAELFPQWRGHLLVASLAQQHLRLVRLDDGKVVGEETVFKGKGRIRDVTVGPDGSPYVAMGVSPGFIYKLVPAR